MTVNCERDVFLEARGTRASNPHGTRASRAIRRTAREDARGIVILDLAALPQRPRVVQLFIGNKFGYSNAAYAGFYAVTCVL